MCFWRIVAFSKLSGWHCCKAYNGCKYYHACNGLTWFFLHIPKILHNLLFSENCPLPTVN